jgi:hypothetical protein
LICGYPESLGDLLPVMYPGANLESLTVARQDGALCIAAWDAAAIGHPQPTPEEVQAFSSGPVYLAYVRAARIAALKPAKELHWSEYWDESAMRNAMCNIPTGATGQMSTDRATLETYWAALVGAINAAADVAAVEAIMPEWPTLVGVANV